MFDKTPPTEVKYTVCAKEGCVGICRASESRLNRKYLNGITCG